MWGLWTSDCSPEHRGAPPYPQDRDPALHGLQHQRVSRPGCQGDGTEAFGTEKRRQRFDKKTSLRAQGVRAGGGDRAHLSI